MKTSTETTIGFGGEWMPKLPKRLVYTGIRHRTWGVYVLLKWTETTTSHNQKIWPDTPNFMAYHFRGITFPDPGLTPNLQVQQLTCIKSSTDMRSWYKLGMYRSINELKKKKIIFTPISWHLLTKNSRRWSPLALLRSLMFRKSSGEAYMLSTSSKPGSQFMINTINISFL